MLRNDFGADYGFGVGGSGQGGWGAHNGDFMGNATYFGGQGPSGASGGGGGAGGGVGVPVWDAEGNFIGYSSVTGASTTGGGVPWSTILDYGLPAAQGFLQNGQNQANFELELAFRREQLKQQRDLANQKTAFDESTLDPFRGYMAQGRDMGRLDLMLDGSPNTPVQPDAKYGAGFTPHPWSYTPSALTRQVLTSARTNVSNGRTVPTMTDPANWGKTPVVSLDGSNPNGTPPAGATPAALLLASARRRRNMLNDPRSPWIEAA
jgi:hypothetical protein